MSGPNKVDFHDASMVQKGCDPQTRSLEHPFRCSDETEARIPAFNASLYLRPTDRKEIQRKCRESEFLTKVQEALLNEENISNDYSIGIAWKPQS